MNPRTLNRDSKVSFTYNAEGLRISRTVNGEKTVFAWDGDQLVMELSESGKVQKRYVRGNDLIYADKGAGTAKLHKDHWDVSDGKGRKIKEVDFNGRQIWPNGPKNKNK